MEILVNDEQLLVIRTELPPTLNQSYMRRTLRSGGKALMLTPRASEFKRTLSQFLRYSGVAFVPGQYIRAAVWQCIEHRRYRRWPRDVDANVKLVLDAMCQGLGFDDRHIWQCTLFKVLTERDSFLLAAVGNSSTVDMPVLSAEQVYESFIRGAGEWRTQVAI